MSAPFTPNELHGAARDIEAKVDRLREIFKEGEGDVYALVETGKIIGEAGATVAAQLETSNRHLAEVAYQLRLIQQAIAER